MKSYFIQACVELVDGSRLRVSTSLDITDEHSDSLGTGIVTSGISAIQDLLSLPIDFVESFSVSLDSYDEL